MSPHKINVAIRPCCAHLSKHRKNQHQSNSSRSSTCHSSPQGHMVSWVGAAHCSSPHKSGLPERILKQWKRRHQSNGFEKQHLSEEPFRSTKCFRRMLPITHLHTSQCCHKAMLRTLLQDAGIAVMGLCVIVASCELCGMAAGVVPPVHSGYLEADFHSSACRLPLGPVQHKYSAAMCNADRRRTKEN